MCIFGSINAHSTYEGGLILKLPKPRLSFTTVVKKQMEKLVELMKANPDIGRGKLPFGRNKIQLKEKWDHISEQLNALGPPIKSTKEWQRVWTHYKANLKRKLGANKRNFQATGGGPSTEISLSPLEQSTVELVSMQAQVNPSRSAMGLNHQEDSDGAELTVGTGEPLPIVESIEAVLPNNRRRSKNRLEDERLEILKNQAKNQEEILKTLKRLESNSYKNYQMNKKNYELKKRRHIGK